MDRAERDWLLLLLGALLLQRVLELLWATATRRRLLRDGATPVQPDGMAGIVAVHALFFAALLAESFAPWSGLGWWTWPGLVLFASGQALRLWAIATLGWRWNTRVLVHPAPRLVGGPYRLLRHPNYVGVVVETTGVLLAFGSWVGLVTVGALHLVALRRRIRIEDAAWARGAFPSHDP